MEATVIGAPVPKALVAVLKGPRALNAGDRADDMKYVDKLNFANVKTAENRIEFVIHADSQRGRHHQPAMRRTLPRNLRGGLGKRELPLKLNERRPA
mgnify:CR=1 FL=1